MWLFFITQYNSLLSSFAPNFRILTQVVAEKSLTEKNTDRQTNKQTNIITEKAKTIYPYILRTGGKIIIFYSLHPSQRFFSQVGTDVPGLNQF